MSLFGKLRRRGKGKTNELEAGPTSEGPPAQEAATTAEAHRPLGLDVWSDGVSSVVEYVTTVTIATS